MTSIRCISTILFDDNYISEGNIIRPTDESIIKACQQAIQEYHDEMTRRDKLDDKIPLPPALMRSEKISTLTACRDILDEINAPPYIFMSRLYSYFKDDSDKIMSSMYGNIMLKDDEGEYWMMDFSPLGITAVQNSVLQYF
mgnify:CR=1 FL=1